MQEPDCQYLDSNGITLRTVVAGEGPLVILLHGATIFGSCQQSA